MIWILLLFITSDCVSDSVDCWRDSRLEQGDCLANCYKTWELIINQREVECINTRINCEYEEILKELPYLLDCFTGPGEPNQEWTTIVSDYDQGISTVETFTGLTPWCWKFDYGRDGDVDLKDIYYFYEEIR